MRKGFKVTEIESEVGFCIGMGSFLTTWATASIEIESEVGLCNNDSPASLSIMIDLATRRDLFQ